MNAARINTQDENAGSETEYRPMCKDSLKSVSTRFILRTHNLFLFIAVSAFAVYTASALLPIGGPTLANAPSKTHGVIIMIDSDDEKVMGHAISYSLNIVRSYSQKNKTVQIEIVANGSGIKIFRADTSPLQAALAALRQTIPGIVFSMCGSSKLIAEQKEGHSIDLIAGARLVPFGIGRVVELEEGGWSYIHG
jgi:intracellular sulfur oxidation DsrE/DsrF family protein